MLLCTSSLVVFCPSVYIINSVSFAIIPLFIFVGSMDFIATTVVVISGSLNRFLFINKSAVNIIINTATIDINGFNLLYFMFLLFL